MRKKLFIVGLLFGTSCFAGVQVGPLTDNSQLTNGAGYITVTGTATGLIGGYVRSIVSGSNVTLSSTNGTITIGSPGPINVGTYVSGTDWMNGASIVPGYTGQLATTPNRYLYQYNGSDWTGDFNIPGYIILGDATHMRPNTSGDRVQIWVNGSGTNQIIGNPGSADNALSLHNQAPDHYPAMNWYSNGLDEKGAVGYGNPSAPIYALANYNEDFGNSSGFYFVSSGFFNGGLEKSTGNFVWYGASASSATSTAVVARIDQSGNATFNGTGRIKGIITVGSGSGVTWTDSSGLIQPAALSTTGTYSFGKITLSGVSVPAVGPLTMDIHGNGCGLNYNSSNGAFEMCYGGVGLVRLFDSSTIYLDASDSTNVRNGNLNITSASKGLVNSGTLHTAGASTFDSTVTASSFIGSGTSLTGIPVITGSANASIDFGIVASGFSATILVPCAGSGTNDCVVIGKPSNGGMGIQQAWVAASGTVAINSFAAIALTSTTQIYSFITIRHP